MLLIIKDINFELILKIFIFGVKCHISMLQSPALTPFNNDYNDAIVAAPLMLISVCVCVCAVRVCVCVYVCMFIKAHTTIQLFESEVWPSQVAFDTLHCR